MFGMICRSIFKNGSVKMQLQIHDELVFKFVDDVVDEVSGKIKTIMENVLRKEVQNYTSSC